MSTLTLPFGDTPDRELIRTGLDESLFVEAAAGTGKTYELVQRATRLLATGRAAIDQLVIVTFTRKAAGELQLRLRQTVDDARATADTPAARQNLDEALARLEEAHIGTIHGFCAEILRERPVEARVDPDFVELSEGQDAALHAEVFRAWLNDRLSALPMDLERALRRDADFGSWDDTPFERLAGASRALLQWRDHEAPWERPAFDLSARLSEIVAQARSLADMVRACPDPEDPLARALAPVIELVDWWHESAVAPGAAVDLPALEGQVLTLDRALHRAKAGKASYGPFAPGVRRKDVEQARESLRTALRTFRFEAEADLAAGLRKELDAVTDRYQAVKGQRGQLDYLDLLIKVRDVVRDQPETRRFLQQKYTHILVDEFQDTDALQVELLLLLAADDPNQTDWRQARPVPGKLFVVGDPKQSIYRFRRADVSLYRDVRDQMSAMGVRVVRLSRSFRANRALQTAVNLSFGPIMTPNARSGQAEYVALEGGAPPFDDQPSVIALPVPHLHHGARATKTAAEACQPQSVAAWIDWLCHDSGWEVREPGTNERRPVKPRDVCILFSRLQSYGEDRSQRYADALDARRLPHVLVGTWSFKARPEIDALLAALTAVEWPEDELSVYAALRGPLLALADSDLLRYRSVGGKLHPFAAPPAEMPDNLRPVADALALLRGLCEQRNERPFADTVHRLLEATRAHVGLALRPAGRRALANVQRVADLARTFELQGGLSFRGFVEAFEEDAARARGNEGPVDEPGTEGVRLMTVYAAKGLEFPVVILADVTASATRPPSQHVDASQGLAALKLLGCTPQPLRDNVGLERARDEAEAVRLAYVAATRARDLLVVNTVGVGMQTFFSTEGKARSWVSPLEPILYPSLWAEAAPAPGIPKLQDNTCLSFEEQKRSIEPGLHFPTSDGPPVVWWDPATLQLDAPLPFGLRQEEYLAADPDAERAGRDGHAEWRRRHADAIDAGNVASVLPLAASEAAHDPPDFDGFVDEVVLPIVEGRPGGVRFGAVVHAILKDTPLGADAPAVTALARMHARILGATEAEAEAAAEAVTAALDHDLFARARAAEACHREWPILFATDDGETLDGAVDLAFFEDGQWVIVDFKTDQDPEIRIEQYRRQMAWYVRALSETTQSPASGILLRI